MSDQKIEFYKGPAGGWGALRSVKNALMRQDIPVSYTHLTLPTTPYV